MNSTLSPYRLGKARNAYNLFNAFNSFSFALLSGNVITLYALRLHATSTTIGLLNAYAFAAFFFMPLGKRLVKYFPIIRIFAAAWICRYLFMIPLVFVPFAAAAGREDLALTFMLVGVFGFNASRGVGMIGNNPVLNEMASGHDRGAYMTHVQVINSAVAMFSSFALALLLGRDPPLFLYAVIMVVGIVSGIAGSTLLYRIPEPKSGNVDQQSRFLAIARRAFGQAPFRRFILIFLGVSFASAVARTFTVVYSREVYLQGDGLVTLYTVFGGLGALMMGIFTRLLVDRVGAKPLYITYTVVAALSLIPAILAPQAGAVAGGSVVLFLSFLQFSVNFGFAGAEGVAQNYFFGLVRPEELLDLGILYYIVYGSGGAVGSFTAGLLLDFFAGVGFSPLTAYRILFLGILGFLAVVLYLQRNLIRLGALPLRGALGVIFSFRDLRAITLLDKLDKTRTTGEETALLEALHDAPSRLALSELLERARSPRLSVRTGALRAIEALDTLTPEAEGALAQDTENNPFTTAHISARILGNHRAVSAVPLLRGHIRSEDYMLAGEAMLALARLGDEASRLKIHDLVAATRNPRLKIMGTAALEVYASPEALPVLLDLLRQENPPPYLRDEVTLAIAGLLGIQERFYPLLVRYVENPALAPALALDEVDAATERYRVLHPKRKKSRSGAAKAADPPDQLRLAVAEYMEAKTGTLLSRWILDLKDQGTDTVLFLLAEATLDDDLNVHDRFRLLVSAWAADRLNPRPTLAP